MTLAELKARLATITSKLGARRALLAIARRRVQHFASRAQNAHEEGVKAAERAAELRSAGHELRAAYWDRKAARCHHRAFARHQKAEWWIARVKQLVQQEEFLQHLQEDLEDRIKEWIKEHGVVISGNKVEGGTPRQRLVAGAHKSAKLSASGARHSFYSQPGFWDVDHGITGEAPGARSDCSQWVTAMYHSAGLPDPNGNSYNGGYTGTLSDHGKKISRANLKPGDLVLYGTYPFHHVEMYVGPGDLTIGHGSAPVDAGSIGMLGGPVALCTALTET
jgi:hypothetical protein